MSRAQQALDDLYDHTQHSGGCSVCDRMRKNYERLEQLVKFVEDLAKPWGAEGDPLNIEERAKELTE